MSNKDIFGKVGFIIIVFFLFVFFLGAQESGTWAILQTTDPSSANEKSLELLWTTLVTATLIQGFLIYAALLGSNLQFTPVTKKQKDKEEHQ